MICTKTPVASDGVIFNTFEREIGLLYTGFCEHVKNLNKLGHFALHDESEQYG